MTTIEYCCPRREIYNIVINTIYFLNVEKIYGVFNYNKKIYSIFYYILYFPEGKIFFMAISTRKIQYNITLVDLTI